MYVEPVEPDFNWLRYLPRKVMRGSVHIVDMQPWNLIDSSSVRLLKLYRKCARRKTDNEVPDYEFL